MLSIYVNLERSSSLNVAGETRVKVSEVLDMLRRDGWVHIATRGSHRQFKHPIKAGRVTVAGKPRLDLHPATLKSILKQSGLKR